MSKEFTITATEVKELPKRAYRKGSKFDATLALFKGKKIKLTAPTTINGEYLATQLNKRIKAMGRTDVRVTCIAGVVYLIPREE